VVSDGEIIAHAPAGTGTVAVTVKTTAGVSDPPKADDFTYLPPSQVLDLSPDSGTTSGGTTVVIKGNSFDHVEKVSFGSRAARFKVVSAGEIAARSPAGNGAVAVVVTTPGGVSASTGSDQFTYKAASKDS
jgi:large repetitive protein